MSFAIFPLLIKAVDSSGRTSSLCWMYVMCNKENAVCSANYVTVTRFFFLDIICIKMLAKIIERSRSSDAFLPFLPNRKSRTSEASTMKGFIFT